MLRHCMKHETVRFYQTSFFLRSNNWVKKVTCWSLRVETPKFWLVTLNLLQTREVCSKSISHLSKRNLQNVDLLTKMAYNRFHAGYPCSSINVLLLKFFSYFTFFHPSGQNMPKLNQHCIIRIRSDYFIRRLFSSFPSFLVLILYP